MNDLQKKYFVELKKIAKERQEKLVSKAYVSAKIPVIVKCSDKSHPPFKITPSKLKIDRWCPRCGGSHKKSIEELRKVAKARGGELLTKKYKDNKTLMLWKCRNPHHKPWRAAFHNILRGKWCPYCARTARLTVKDMKETAKLEGGKFLSKTFKTVNDKHL